jgi:RNA polymerase sigma-70 factor, ECF subfamily
VTARAPDLPFAVSDAACVGRDGTERFEALYAAHRDGVYRLGLRFGGGRSAWAEDLTHEVFLKLLANLPSLDAPDDIGGWLYRVTANLAISALRREQSWKGKLERLFVGEPATEPPPDEALAREEEAAAAVVALRALPGPERVVLTMKVLDGMSQKEIASALSMSEGYVSKLVTRSWSRLRAAGWEDSDNAP